MDILVDTKEGQVRIHSSPSIHCQGPFCDKYLDVDKDFIQVDMPGERFKAFCSIACLRNWAVELRQE